MQVWINPYRISSKRSRPQIKAARLEAAISLKIYLINRPDYKPRLVIDLFKSLKPPWKTLKAFLMLHIHQSKTI